MTSHRIATILTFGAFALLAQFAPGCRDEFAPPTQGFIEIDTGGVSGVEVFLDGVSQGVDPERLGPLPEGTYTVRVARECFGVTPDSGIEVDVVAAGTVVSNFLLAPREFGSVTVRAVDEVLGEDVAGAAIFLEDSGVFLDTGSVTPGTIDLPCGPARLALRREGFGERILDVQVDSGAATEAVAELGPARQVIAEMFTYVTCPNCPPAVDEFEELLETNPGFFVIEWHSVAGLPLYDARWRTRENFYTGGSPAGWPAVVFQGGHLEAAGEKLIIGSQASDLSRYHERLSAYLAQCANDCPVALVASGSIGAASAEITAHVKRRPGSVPAGVTLRFVLLESEVPAPGNDSPYSFVPRELVEQALTLPAEGTVAEFPASLPVDVGWDRDRLHWVVFLQSSEDGEILAVDGLRL